MEMKKITIKKETKVKKCEESKTEVSNAGFIRTTKSEIFTESSVIDTELLTNRMRMEQCTTERRNCPGNMERVVTTNPDITDDFSRGKQTQTDRGDVSGENESLLTMDNNNKVALDECNEASNSSECTLKNSINNSDVATDGSNEVSSSSERKLKISLNNNNAALDECNEVANSSECKLKNSLNKNDVAIDGSNEVSSFSEWKIKKSLNNNDAASDESNKISKSRECKQKTSLNIRYIDKFEGSSSPTNKHKNDNSDENGIGDKNQLNMALDGDRNVINSDKTPKKGNSGNDLNLVNEGKISKINSIIEILSSQSCSLHKETTKSMVDSQNEVIKRLKTSSFIYNDLYNRGDSSLISSTGDKTNLKKGRTVGRVNLNRSVSSLVNYFENMKTLNQKETNLKLITRNFEKELLSEPTKNPKRKLPDELNSPNRNMIPDTLKSGLSSEESGAVRCPRKKCFASKNIGLSVKSKKIVCTKNIETPIFNFNNNSAEFCVVKCTQNRILSKEFRNTPRLPREHRFIFPDVPVKDSNHDQNVSSRINIKPPSLQMARSMSGQPNSKIAKSPNEQNDRNGSFLSNKEVSIRDNQTGVNENINEQQKNQLKMNKSNIDLQKIVWKPNLEMDGCMNNRIISNQSLKRRMIRGKETISKTKNDDSCAKYDTCLVKRFSTLFLFMIIFAFGSYYQFFK